MLNNKSAVVMTEKHFQTVQIEKAAAGSAYNATFVMSASGPDRVNDTIDVKAYQKNVGKIIPALFGHNHEKIIGAWENLRLEGDRLIGDLRTAGTGLGKMVAQLLADNIPISASIGFSGKGSRNDKGGMHFKELDIYECSIVAVPCHASAQRIKALEIAREYGFEDELLIDEPQSEEQLLEKQARAIDAKDRAAVAVKKATAVLAKSQSRLVKG